MNYEEIFRDLSSLPPEGQKEASDFIASLHERYARSNSGAQAGRDLTSLTFVGMWRDREEMRASTAWVRSLRSS